MFGILSSWKESEYCRLNKGSFLEKLEEYWRTQGMVPPTKLKAKKELMLHNHLRTKRVDATFFFLRGIHKLY